MHAVRRMIQSIALYKEGPRVEGLVILTGPADAVTKKGHRATNARALGFGTV